MEDVETEVGVGAEEFVDGAGGAGELGVVVIVDDDDSLVTEAREDEAEADFDGRIEVAVAKGERDLFGQIGGGKITKPGFLHNDARGGRVGTGRSFKTIFVEFVNNFTLGHGELASLEIGAGAGGVFPGLLGEAGEGIVEPQRFDETTG